MLSFRAPCCWQIVIDNDSSCFCRVQEVPVNATEEESPDRPASPRDTSSQVALLIDIPFDIYRLNVFLGIDAGKFINTAKSVNRLVQELRAALVKSSDITLLNSFRDEHYEQNIPQTWINLTGVRDAYKNRRMPVEETQTRFALAFIFWKGMVEFLRDDDAWRRLNARYVYLISAWQWFHLARSLAGWNYWALVKAGEARVSILPGWAHNELVQATRLLQTLLRDPENANAMRMLYANLAVHQEHAAPVGYWGWLAEKAARAWRWLRRTARKPVPTETDDQPLLMRSQPPTRIPEVEQLLLSMALIPEEQARAVLRRDDQPDPINLCGDRVVDDPSYTQRGQDGRGITWDLGGVIHNRRVGSHFGWQGLAVHPVFAAARGWQLKDFARQLIGGVLLPRYNLTGAVRMAYLLRQQVDGRKEPDPERKPAPMGKFIGQLVVLSLLLGVVMIVLPRLAGLVPPLARWGDWPAIILSWVLLAAMARLLLVNLDGSVSQYLLLPRLLGGMMVGYLALALQGDSMVLKNTLFAGQVNGFLITAGLNVITMLIGFTYLYFESLSIVHDEHIARPRALLLLLVSLLASAFIGLFVVGLTTRMEQLSDSFRAANQSLWLVGPTGMMDARQYFVFVPLAMLTGFVSQFIFEEKAITAPVWEEK